jgi:hypothetical protein
MAGDDAAAPAIARIDDTVERVRPFGEKRLIDGKG